MDYRLTSHAIIQFSKRAGVHVDKARDVLIACLSASTEKDYSQVIDTFPILSRHKGDTYLEFFCPTIRENMVAIKRKDGAIVTVLTQKIFDIHPLQRHRKLNHGGAFTHPKNFSQNA